MEQSPLAGYLKAFTFGILAFVIFLTVWQKSKTEDKIVALDKTVLQLKEQVAGLRTELREHRSAVDRLAGGNEQLGKLLARIAKGGLTVRNTGPSAGTDAPSQPAEEREEDVGDLYTDKPQDWGWHLNARLDRGLDPNRPLGTPGRYKNFLKLDPDGSPVPKKAPNYDGTISLPWSSEPKGFNFLLENYATLSMECEAYVQDAPASRHWKNPSSFNWAPALCWRVEANPDFTEYTLFFRRDAYWQPPPPDVDTRVYKHLAGKFPVTARDLAFTFRLIMDPNTNLAVARSYYNELKDWQVVDDYTIVVRWKKTQFNSLAYTLGASIFPRHVYAYDENGNPYPEETVGQEFNEHWFDQLRAGPIGCGPYRFMKYEPGKYIRMERWEDWYGFKEEPRYPIRARHMKIYEDPEKQFDWIRTGEIDIGGLNAARLRNWVLEETDPNSPFKNGSIDVKVNGIRSPGYLYIGWKNSDPMFADKRVRQALTYACDRFHICSKIFLNRYEPMASPVYPDSPEADPELKPYPFDLDKARQLLDEAGWTLNPATGLREKVIEGEKRTFEFKLYWPGPSAEFQNALDHYKNDLLKIGIRMEPQSVQWAQFQKDLSDRKYRAFSLLWMLNGWEHDFGQIWHSRMIQEPRSSNYIEFSNPELDRLADALRDTMDPQKRIQIVRRIGRILYEEQPYTFFGWRKVFRCYWNRVKNHDVRYYIRPFMRTFPFWIER